MDKLNQSAINDVLNTKPRVRAEVLYEFLVEGKSHRAIETHKPELIKNHGWSSWKITHFFGFGSNDKGKFSNLDFNTLILQIEDINLEDLAEFHIDNNLAEEKNENDGIDLFRELKVRVGQSKLRKNVLKNYKNKCALCEIKIENLLIASHIKSWAESSQSERIDPSNTILLCRHHDGLFDKGHLSLNDDFQVEYKDKKMLASHGIKTDLVFSLPTESEPNIDYLKHHREKHKII